MDNVRLELSAIQIMAKHEQHYYKQDLLENCGHIVILSFPMTYTMPWIHMLVKLEYKCHWDVATSVKLWTDVNPNKM